MKTLVFSLALFVLSIVSVLAQKPAVFSQDGKAIRGYDPVAYFTDGQAVKGDSSLTYTYDGATWQFAGQDHLKAFEADPEKYMPQYGGYCAYGAAQGHKSPTQPDAWTVQDGKLYLNNSLKVRTLWDKDRPGNIQKADTNWPTLKEGGSH